MTREEAIKVAYGIPVTKAQHEALQFLIPELAESDDERIRKDIINLIYWLAGNPSLCSQYYRDRYDGMLAWLEKQKEPKPINHNFTTFHRDVVYCAMCDKNLDEGLRCNLEIVYKIIKDIVDRTPVVEEQKPAESISQLTVQGKGVYKICPRCKECMVRDDSMVYTSMPPQYRYECPKCGESECDTVMYDNPEMKEQKPSINIDQLKSLMLQYLQEAANEKDDLDIEADTDKWARKILGYDFEQKPVDLSEMMVHKEPYIAPVPTPMVADEQKPVEWSESDKQNINLIISYLDSYIKEHNDTYGADECKYLKYWLKSLRPNQSKSEWSEEDEDTINLMIAILRENYSNCLFKTNSANTIRMSAISTDMLIKRIEALRPQPKQEWSKEDERIRKEIYNFFKNFKETGTWKSISDVNTWLAYLEKQKEQKIDIDKEKLIRHCIGLILTDATDKRFKDYGLTLKDCLTWLGEQKEQKPELPKLHKGDDNNPYDMRVSEAQEYAINRGFGIPYNDGEVYVDERHMTQTIGNILRWADEHPKEQKPVDYEAELKKCKDNPLYFYDKYVSIKQKPVEWSEEDEKYLNRVINLWVNDFGEDSDTVKWLKSLRPQPKQEWNEEDERMLSRCVKSIESSKQFADSDTFKKAKDNEIDWLENRIKSFRPVKQEWSKEDEKMLKWAIRIIVEYSDIDEEGSEIVQNWLESLRPQYHGDVTMTEAYKMGLEAGKASHWKPNDEQLRPLEYAIDYFKKKRNDTTYLESLYNDLKKL